MSNNNSEDGIFKRMIQAQIGTPEQSNLIEDHMKEYFTRFRGYENKFTYLEWYNIFLDFLDKIPTPSPKDQPEGQRFIDASDGTDELVNLMAGIPIDKALEIAKYIDKEIAKAKEETSSPAAPELKRIIPEEPYFVAQCEGCGYKASSSEWLGGGQIADTGDYGDTYCPICGHIDCPEAEDDLYTDQTELLKNKVLQLNNKISEFEWQLFEAKIPPEQPVPAAQGEIPKEIKSFIGRWMLDNEDSDLNRSVVHGMAALYHKMQEEIREYRKELEYVAGAFPPSAPAVVRIKELLAKYSHS